MQDPCVQFHWQKCIIQLIIAMPKPEPNLKKLNFLTIKNCSFCKKVYFINPTLPCLFLFYSSWAFKTQWSTSSFFFILPSAYANPKSYYERGIVLIICTRYNITSTAFSLLAKSMVGLLVELEFNQCVRQIHINVWCFAFLKEVSLWKDKPFGL